MGICYDEINNLTRLISDHKIVISVLDLGKKTKKKGFNSKTRWKLNENILNEREVTEGINKFFEQIPYLKNKYKLVWYDKFIGYVVNFLKIKSREIGQRKKEEIRNIFQKLDELNRNNLGLSQEEIREEMVKLEKEIENFYENIRKGIEKRQRDKKFHFAKHPTKILVEKINKNEKKSEIKKYLCKNGMIVTEKKDILNDVNEYYRELLGTDKENKEEINNYRFKIKNVENAVKEYPLDLNAPIRYDEALEVINNMQESSPGENGLTIGFYKKYFEHFGNHFIEILNDSKNILPNTFRVSIIKLIPKNENEIKGSNDLRPISLTNLEYRIYTKILVKRLNRLSKDIFSDFQTCSVKGRRIDDCITVIRDLILDAIQKNKELYLTSIDQRKAFDSMFHNYLFAIVKHMKFGEFLTNSIIRIYRESYAYMEINKTISEKKIDIKRGIKQGCPLSMFLYTLGIEELLIKINDNIQIKGYTLMLTSAKTIQIKNTAYADDIGALNTDINSIGQNFEEFKEWGKISGASVNEDKTKILAINSNFSGYKNIFFVEKIKILGIIFDKTGIAKENFEKVQHNYENCLKLWNNVQLNMVERITVIRTFAMSKLWYLANFIHYTNQQVKKLERIAFKFIWSNKVELIKRNTLILDKLEGGLNMVCIKSKLETIYFRNFLYILKNRYRPQYHFSVYWLKFTIGRDYLENFNIIPSGDDRHRPLIYSNIIKANDSIKKLYKTWFDKHKASCIQKINNINSEPNILEERKKSMIDKINKSIKKYDVSHLKAGEFLSSKEIYNFFLGKFIEKPKIGNLTSNETANVFKDLHRINKCSYLKSLNYRLIYNALPCNKKFKNRYGKICYLCKREVDETIEHIFIECHKINECLKKMRTKLEKPDMMINIDTLRYKVNISENDYRIFSYYINSVWRIRNILKHSNENLNINTIFLKFFGKWLISQTEI